MSSGELLIQVTQQSWEKISKLVEDNLLPKSLCRQIKECDGKIPISTMLEVARLDLNKVSHIRLNHLMMDAELMLPANKVEPPNPDLQLRLQRLKAEQQEHEYKKMVRNVTKPQPRRGNTSAPVISALNFAITVLACVFGSIFVLQNIVPNLLLRCAFGFTVGIILMCIEIFLAVRAVSKEAEE